MLTSTTSSNSSPILLHSEHGQPVITPIEAQWQASVHQIATQMLHWKAHPVQTVVLIDHPALTQVAQDMWRRIYPNGFLPQFHTLHSWCETLPPTPLTELDLHLQYPVDILQANRWLQMASQDWAKSSPSTQAALTGQVLQSAYEIAGTLRALLPQDRSGWAARAQAMLQNSQNQAPFQAELLCTSVALQWAAQSSYATDVLFQDETRQKFRYLIMLPSDPTPDAISLQLATLWGECAALINTLHTQPLLAKQALATNQQASAFSLSAAPTEPALSTRVETHFHPCEDAHSQALAVCQHVLQLLKHPSHNALTSEAAPINQPTNQSTPHLALVSLDRSLSRRICAMLAQQGIEVELASGHKLSTTLAAAHVILALQASAPDASCDAVLAWLKICPALSASEVNLLELALRRHPTPLWQDTQQLLSASKDHVLVQLVPCIEAWRAIFNPVASIPNTGRNPTITHADWLQQLAAGLQACGLWAWLLNRSDGQAVLAQLGWLGMSMELGGIEDIHPNPNAHQLLNKPPSASALTTIFEGNDLPLRAAQWHQWVRDSLEQGIWKPTRSADSPETATASATTYGRVTLLPLQQVLARPFTQVLIPGCNESTPAHSYQAAAHFNPLQRAQLQLPTLDAHAAHWDHIWQQVLQTQPCHLFWQQHEATGEASAPNRWVLQRWQAAQNAAADSANPPLASVSTQPLAAPSQTLAMAQTTGHQMPFPALSPSAYADLRQCPYRFWAQRLLQLQSWPEFEDESPERDFGLWLHSVLHQFHLPQSQQRIQRGESAQAVLDDLATQILLTQQVPPHLATPWMSSWPSIRDSYLAWQSAHSQQGWAVSHTEAWLEQPLTDGERTWRLLGKIDRVDTSEQGLLVLDYKTESKVRSKARLQDMTEDVQLAFYTLLLQAPNNQAPIEDQSNTSENAPTHKSPPITAGYLQFHDREGCTLLAHQDMSALAHGLQNQITHDLRRIALGEPLKALGQAAACTHCQMRGICRKDDWSDDV